MGCNVVKIESVAETEEEYGGALITVWVPVNMRNRFVLGSIEMKANDK